MAATLAVALALASTCHSLICFHGIRQTWRDQLRRNYTEYIKWVGWLAGHTGCEGS
jgi:hypothetical protein